MKEETFEKGVPSAIKVTLEVARERTVYEAEDDQDEPELMSTILMPVIASYVKNPYPEEDSDKPENKPAGGKKDDEDE